MTCHLYLLIHHHHRQHPHTQQSQPSPSSPPPSTLQPLHLHPHKQPQCEVALSLCPAWCASSWLVVQLCCVLDAMRGVAGGLLHWSGLHLSLLHLSSFLSPCWFLSSDVPSLCLSLRHIFLYSAPSLDPPPLHILSSCSRLSFT